MNKAWLIVLVFVIALSFLFSNLTFAKEPVKIGIITPLSGIVAQGGKEIKYGIEMAAEEKGSLLGRPIETIAEDTQIKPSHAVSKAEKLVFKDGCVALIGVFSSGVGLAIAENIERLNVPFVTTHVMTTKFYNISDYCFRSGQLANDQTARANMMGILSTPDLRDRSYYVLVHDYAWGYDVAERFIRLAKANDVEVVNDRYARAPTSTKDWSSYITKIKASGADGVYIGLITDVIPAFVKQARQYGLKAKIVSGALPGPKALQACGEDCLGLVAAGDWAWDVDTPKSNDWEKRFWEKYDLIPSDAAAHSYCGAMNLLRAIERAGSTDPDKIAACLKGVSFDGPYGHVRISAMDNCMRNSAVLTETKKAPDNPYGAKIYMDVLHTFPWYTIQRGKLKMKDKKLVLEPYDELSPLE